MYGLGLILACQDYLYVHTLGETEAKRLREPTSLSDGLGFRVWALGVRVSGLGFMV